MTTPDQQKLEYQMLIQMGPIVLARIWKHGVHTEVS